MSLGPPWDAVPGLPLLVALDVYIYIFVCVLNVWEWHKVLNACDNNIRELVSKTSLDKQNYIIFTFGIYRDRIKQQQRQQKNWHEAHNIYIYIICNNSCSRICVGRVSRESWKIAQSLANSVCIFCPAKGSVQLIMSTEECVSVWNEQAPSISNVCVGFFFLLQNIMRLIAFKHVLRRETRKRTWMCQPRGVFFLLLLLFRYTHTTTHNDLVDKWEERTIDRCLPENRRHQPLIAYPHITELAKRVNMWLIFCYPLN